LGLLIGVPTDPALINPDAVAQNLYTPIIKGSTKDLGNAVVPKRWFHVLVSVATDSLVTYAGGLDTMWIAINGVSRGLDGPFNNDLADPLWTNGEMAPFMMNYNDGFRTDYAFGFRPSQQLSAGRDVTCNIPPFDIAIEGYNFSIPYRADVEVDGGNSDYPVVLANVQIWVGQCIEPSESNMQKFLRHDPDDENKVLMVSPSVAQAAFGKPTFFFDGPPSKFATNRGSGGEFTKVGDLKKFTPYPPKAPASDD